MATRDVPKIATRTGRFTTLEPGWALIVVTVAVALALSVRIAAQPAIPNAAPFDFTAFIQSAPAANPSDLFHAAPITVTNIRMADVDDQVGWGVLEIDGDTDEIDRSIEWMQSKGVPGDPSPADGVEG